jgi:dTMP kinase
LAPPELSHSNALASSMENSNLPIPDCPCNRIALGKIEPALQAGKIVISDRFTDASFAYQGGGRGLSLEKLNALEMWVQGRAGGTLLQPNLTILFDLPGAIAEARRSQVRAPDKFEQMDLNFFERVRQEYLRRAKADPKRFHLVDATQTREAIWEELKSLPLEI